jgi:3',5'-cyclic AMP phosphodiesterase CpdA
MNDYSYIYTWSENKPRLVSVHDIQKIHKRHARFITASIKFFTEKKIPTVLITHHKPVADATNVDYLTQAYETDMRKIIEIPNSTVKYAFHGHTHVHYDKTYNNVRYMSNPKGYPSQRTNYDIDFLVSL